MERVVILICYVRNNNNNNNAIYKAHVSTLQSAQGAIDTITLALARPPFRRTSISRNKYSCQVPIYYTWVERGNCG